MKYAKAVNAIVACMSVDADVFKRINNKPKQHSNADGITNTLDCRMEITGDLENNTSFVIKTMQVASDAMLMTSEKAYAMLSEDQPSVKRISVDPTKSSRNDYPAACRHAGIDATDFSPILRDITNIVKMYLPEGKTDDMIVFANKQEDNGSVGLIFQMENEVLVIQVKD